MAEDTSAPDVAQLAAACASAADATDPEDLAELVRMALAAGATPEEILASPNLGELILDHQLRPPGQRTAGEVVGELELPWPEAEPYLAALGLPLDPAARLTEGEADAARLVVGGARRVLGEDAALQVARVAGNVTARLAETLVDAFRLRVEVPRRDAGVGYSEIVREYTALANALLPMFSRSLDALVVRQILAVAATMWSTDTERSAVTVPRAVGFVDLVGYTERTASMTVRELTAALLDFDRCTADIVLRHGGSVVKSIGDEILFATATPSDGCRIALDLVEASGTTALPAVRVGVASGEMVSVFGDLYGPDVNLAARLVVAADPSTAVVSASVRDGAPSFRFAALPPLTLKGLAEPVTAYRLLRPADDGPTAG